jgi:hypothetical protein
VAVRVVGVGGSKRGRLIWPVVVTSAECIAANVYQGDKKFYHPNYHTHTYFYQLSL